MVTIDICYFVRRKYPRLLGTHTLKKLLKNSTSDLILYGLTVLKTNMSSGPTYLLPLLVFELRRHRNLQT